MIKIIPFNYSTTLDLFSDLLADKDRPVWIGRNGGSDTDFVQKWDGVGLDHDSVRLVKKLNGYYDKDNTLENLNRFRSMYLESSKNMDLAMVHFCSIFGDALKGDERDLEVLENRYGIKEIMCYRFVENCTYFLESFQKWGEGKKILVISPFSESIRYQTSPERIRKILKPEFAFPDCEFLTYDSPITYSEDGWLCSDVGEERNWFYTAQRMFDDIAKLDFDIAWLSCGSYAMFLGDKIKSDLKKSSIYLGGVANTFFNLYNYRYSSTGHDQCVVNLDYQIDSLENKSFFTPENVSRFPWSEGIRAYFGKGGGN